MQIILSANKFQSTVFAPAEMAFGKLASGVLNNLMKRETIKELTSVLNYLVVEGQYK